MSPDRATVSVLFDNAPGGDTAHDRADGGRTGEPSYFADPNLDQVVSSITAGQAEYRLESFWYAPVGDTGTVAYRHAVFRDLENRTVVGHVSAFAERMRHMRRCLARADKLRYPVQKQRWFLDAVDAYGQAVTGLVHDLAQVRLSSRGLRAVRDYLTGYAGCVVSTAVLSSLDDPQVIAYRQRVLADCLAQPAAVREIYDPAVLTLTRQRRIWAFGMDRHPDSPLHHSVEVLELLVDMLKRLRRIADEHAGSFRSDGFTGLFESLAKELDDDYFATVKGHLRRLRFRADVQFSVGLGAGNKGSGFVLRRPHDDRPGWMARLLGGDHDALTFTIADRDEAGARALADLRQRGIDPVANALAQSTDHIVNFFVALRAELGFYVGCLNLADRLAGKGEPICFPQPQPVDRQAFTCRGLYDPCLTLGRRERVVGKDVDADGRSLVMITGANQGGKSTFLRSVGLAYLMTQCGMFAPTRALRLSPCRALFTHFKREEDATMTSGRPDEELSRMSLLADRVAAHGVVLFNESFSSTNEREGSKIARQIVSALTEAGVRVFFVTHLFDLADGFWRRPGDTGLSLGA